MLLSMDRYKKLNSSSGSELPQPHKTHDTSGSLPPDIEIKLLNQERIRQQTRQKRGAHQQLTFRQSPKKKQITAETLMKQASSKEQKSKMRQLIRHIIENPERYAWDSSTGEVELDGKRMPGSDILELADLATSSFKPSAKNKPPGWTRFVESLHASHAPETIKPGKKKSKSKSPQKTPQKRKGDEEDEDWIMDST